MRAGRLSGRGRRAPLALAAALALLAAVATLLVPPAPSRAAAAAPAAAPAAVTRHTVTYDHYSLMVDGRRVLLWAGEFHYFRLPSPDLWRDVLERIRAAGFNGISIYLDWAYHSPKAGVYDFSGVRDVDRLLRLTDELGLYVVARPGPYINAEVTGGGLPAWLTQVPGRARSSAPGYQAAYRDWLSRVNPIIARHQLTRGGSVIAYNVENEYAVNVDPAYMEDLQRIARADGIDVPITHNNCCGGFLANWSSGPGAVQIAGVDDYPQSFDCAHPDLWGPWGDGITRRLRDDAPVFAAEYQAGAIDLFNAGYEGCRALTGPSYMKFFHKSNIVGSGATMFSYYMAFGGTNWGWLRQPNDVYTSYDYGAAITEARQLTAKYDEFKRQGYFVTTVRPLTRTDPAAAPVSDNPALETSARVNPDSATQFVLVRHADHASTADTAATLDWTTPDGRYQVPVRVDGRDAKLLVAGYDLGGQRLVWSSSEIMTHALIGGRDVALLYGRDGEAGATVLRYPARPTVRVLEGTARSSYDQASGDLRLDYTHGGLARVLVSGGGRRPLLLLLGSDQVAAQFWRLDAGAGGHGDEAAPTVLVRGTSLARSASVRGDTVVLRADSDRAGEVEVFGPASARRLLVNGAMVRARPTPSGSLLATLPGPESVRLPRLSGWRANAEAPEAAPGFDDSRWTVADHTTSPSGYTPRTQPVLFADDYGFHYGSVWYRGRFTATGSETAVSLNAITGKNGIYLVWLNGRFLGSAAGGVEADADTDPPNPDPGRGDFTIPPGLLRPGRANSLAVLVENMGHNDDWVAIDQRFRQPRGLFGAALVGSDARLSWRIQGARGGEDLVDPVRGPLNTGGLFGERAGWHLPGYPDGSWRRANSPQGPLQAGTVAWYRTQFRLSLPRGQDVPIALRIGGDASRRYRVFVFLNGWNLGLFVNDTDPQHDYQLPAGILRGHGDNTLALAVLAVDALPTGPGPFSLVAVANHRGGVHVSDVPSPGFDPHR